MFRYALGATAFAGIGYLGYAYTRGSSALKTNKKESPNFTLLTDLEPDDMVAMKVLGGRDMVPSHVIVGEGNADLKVARAQNYLKDLGWSSQLIKGFGSSKEFEGEETLVSSSSSSSSSLPKMSLLELPDSGFGSTIICLKPLRELVAYADGHWSLLEGKRLVLYGSFNLRTVIEEKGWDAVSWIFDEETSPFSEVILYESYKAIPDAPSTSANPENFKGFWEKLHFDAFDGGRFSKDVYDCLAAWDKAILKDCQETMDGCRDGSYGDPDDPKVVSRFGRNKKCFDQVKAHEGQQFVMADPVLATVFDNPRFETYKTPVKVTYEAPYLVKTPVSSSKVYTYQGMGWDDVCDEMKSCYFKH